jgi:hypothetical protein
MRTLAVALLKTGATLLYLQPRWVNAAYWLAMLVGSGYASHLREGGIGYRADRVGDVFSHRPALLKLNIRRFPRGGRYCQLLSNHYLHVIEESRG